MCESVWSFNHPIQAGTEDGGMTRSTAIVWTLAPFNSKIRIPVVLIKTEAAGELVCALLPIKEFYIVRRTSWSSLRNGQRVETSIR